MKSLDPRVSRLPVPGTPGKILPKLPLDQFGSFEVFVQPKDGKSFQHEGIVHAPNLEMAYVLAKEAFTRRFTCVSMYVVDTREVFVSPMTEADQNVYDQIVEVGAQPNPETYEIYHLNKRGKQHIHAGTVSAGNPEEAMWKAHQTVQSKPVFNIWAVRRAALRRTDSSDVDLWHTLPEKKFRDASDYRGGDKLKDFLEKQKHE
ncbi:MAG: phenylacetic acid degradation b [Cytophagales bacterium]|nr:phenylacetic acid degradation b [Cytophagales bacterium]